MLSHCIFSAWKADVSALKETRLGQTPIDLFWIFSSLETLFFSFMVFMVTNCLREVFFKIRKNKNELKSTVS